METADRRGRCVYLPERTLSNEVETAASLREVRKALGRRDVLAGLTAEFRTGELFLIRGGRGVGKTTLARLLVGQIHPDEGEVRRRHLGPPLLGGAAGFDKGAPVLRGLDLRAAAFGVSSRDYARAIGALMDEPEALSAPFERLRGRDRMIVTHASVWLLPATLFVADGQILPPDAEAKDRLRPLLDAARKRAAVVWIANLKAEAKGLRPDRAARFEHGLLIPEPPPGA